MPNNIVPTRDIIIKLKEVRNEKDLSFADIMDMMEQNGDYTSKTTLSRVFSEGSEDIKFRYEDTIRPIANALLDIDTIEDDDNMDVQAMKSLLQYKDKLITNLEKQIKDLEMAIDKQAIKHNEKVERERESWSRSIEFLKEQISYKDKRMDFLLDAVKDKDDMLKSCMCCSHRKIKEGD